MPFGKKIELGKEFRPERELKKVYRTYLLLFLVFTFLPWYIPILLFAPWIAGAIVGVVYLAGALFFLYWIDLYCDSIVYKFTENEIIWRRGVWFKNTGIVPYNRITNVDISQGPIARHFGLGTLKIQTAGYSAQTGAEVSITGIRNFEELRDFIMGFVEGKKAEAVGTYDVEDTQEKILGELVRIREILEKRDL